MSEADSGPARQRPLVREATPADLPHVQRIYAYHVLHGLASFEEQPPDVAEIARRHAAVQGQGLPYLVAEVEGAVAGYAYVSPYRPRAAYRYTVEDSVYISQDRLARGVGRALLAELLARCGALGLRQMVAVIGDSGNTGSIRLHSALGFAHVGVLRAVGFKHGRWVDTVLMQRALGPGATALPGAARRPGGGGVE
ncbi:MAG TPA: GNAT family N-acetyltransferase [bacterium]|nr:GNAT family N-acetyltransferase [bacterium]